MSISGSLSSAISGLAVTSRMAEVVSDNLSNVLTDGYGRREVQTAPGHLGGVWVVGITRIVDPVILGERRLADSGLANSERFVGSLAQVERAIGTADSEYGLSARLTSFEKSLISASSDPSSEQRLTLSVLRLGDLTEALGDASTKIQKLRQDADAAIAGDVDQLNRSLELVAELNTSIVRARSAGGNVSALIDARQVAVDKIAGIVPVRQLERPNDSIALMTTNGAILLDGKAAEIGFSPTPTIVADMEMSAGVLSGITLNGTPMDPTDGYGRLSGGSLSASFDLRDSVLTEAQLGLDEVAADLITRFESSTVDPTLGSNDPGLLTDNGSKFDVAQLAGLAGRIKINAAVDPENGGQIWRLRDGVSAATQGPEGDAQQINRWLESLNESHSYSPGGFERSANGHIGKLSGDVASDRLRAEETFSFETARWNLLKDSELATGVDSDQELQRLLVIEQAYAANAKLFQTASSMLRTLMEI